MSEAMDHATKAHVRALVIAECDRIGSIRQFAAAKRLPFSLVAQQLNGSRDITDALAATVGFMRPEYFVRVHKPGGAT